MQHATVSVISRGISLTVQSIYGNVRHGCIQEKHAMQAVIESLMRALCSCSLINKPLWETIRSTRSGSSWRTDRATAETMGRAYSTVQGKAKKKDFLSRIKTKTWCSRIRTKTWRAQGSGEGQGVRDQKLDLHDNDNQFIITCCNPRPTYYVSWFANYCNSFIVLFRYITEINA